MEPSARIKRMPFSGGTEYGHSQHPDANPNSKSSDKAQNRVMRDETPPARRLASSIAFGFGKIFFFGERMVVRVEVAIDQFILARPGGGDVDCGPPVISSLIPSAPRDWSFVLGSTSR